MDNGVLGSSIPSGLRRPCLAKNAHITDRGSMLAPIHRLIESALELDQTLSLEDRETILACCRNPGTFRERQKKPEERLLSQSQVGAMLGVSRPTIWRLRKAGRLQPVATFLGNRKFRQSDIQALMAGEAPCGPTIAPESHRPRGREHGDGRR